MHHAWLCCCGCALIQENAETRRMQLCGDDLPIECRAMCQCIASALAWVGRLVVGWVGTGLMHRNCATVHVA